MSLASISKAEQAYIASSLTSKPVVRADGRGLLDYRQISFEMGVSPMSYGSSRVSVGGSEVIVAAKLQVTDLEESLEDQGASTSLLSETLESRLSYEVLCTPAAYPHHTQGQLDDLSADLSTLLHESLLPYLTSPPVQQQLTIVPSRKYWHLSLEAVIVSDQGNIVDTLFVASRGCLWDLRIPRTKGLHHSIQDTGMDIENEAARPGDAFKDAAMGRVGQLSATGGRKTAADFELEDYWDDGVPLEARRDSPVCVTLNVLPPIHFLDATTQEGKGIPNKLHLVFSFPSVPRQKAPAAPGPAVLHGTRYTGTAELNLQLLKTLISAGEQYARELSANLNAKFTDDDRKRNMEIP